MKNRASFAIGFLVLIVIGAILLCAPFSQTIGRWGNWNDSLFTSFSAVCVTGLSVVNIATEYTRTGQIILLILVELGCLGLMTCGTFLLIAIGRRLSLSREFSLMNAYGVAEVQGLRGLICWVVGATLTIETIGAVLYYLLLDDVYLAIFYSIMSFCNAGFSILPGSLATFAESPALILLSGTLTILGGIGFLVVYNLCTFKFLRRRSGAPGRLTLHTRVVLRFTAYLLIGAFLAFLLLEWNGVLKDMPSAQKLWVSFYQAVTPRTCGFCVVPTEELHPLTRLIYEALMFIGGAPGSAAAGLKVTTFATLIYTMTALCRGETETIISRRVIPMDIVRESLVILVALIVFIGVITGALLWTECTPLSATSAKAIPLDSLFFEAVSAVTTTGLSCGETTANLSFAGRCVIMSAMFIGRLGALTVVMIIGNREVHRHVRFPSEELVVG